MANFVTNAARSPLYKTTTQYLNNVALTSLPTASNKTAAQQYAGVYRQGLSDYYKNKASSSDVGKLTLTDAVAVPESAVQKKTATINDTSSSSGSGSGGTSNTYAPYVEQLNALYDKIMNKGQFSYDLNADLLYQQMADQYTQLGQQAMKDTMGQAAALTGGYGNSYAQQVGNQAYQQYLTALNQQIPELYDRAYQVYQDDLDWLLQQYQLTAAHPEYLQAMQPSSTSTSTMGEETTTEPTMDINTYMDLLRQAGITGTSSSTAASTAANNALAQWYYKLLNK